MEERIGKIGKWERQSHTIGQHTREEWRTGGEGLGCVGAPGVGVHRRDFGSLFLIDSLVLMTIVTVTNVSYSY